MSSMTVEQQERVRQIVTPERARFDERERRLYSHDTGVLPSLVRPLAGGSLADGVVQPETEEQLVELVQLAQRERIPLVPRGKGTAGYGGAVPTQGGLVLDLTRLRGLVSVDVAAQTATVRAGTVWQDLSVALEAYGLAPRLYPTSAPASTVGGWLAQGGAGLGSHAYGWFKENVVAALVVGGDGTVREYRGAQLERIADAEGTTGIISELTIRLRPLAEQEQTVVAFADAASMAEAIRRATQAGLPVWSVSFINPKMAELKNAGPPKTHHGHPEPAGPRLPEHRYLVAFAYDVADRQTVVDGLREIALDLGGDRMPGAIARHEWAERFKPMRLKRLGPSVVPIEIVVPRATLAATLADLALTIKAPLAIEGMSVKGDEVVLLGFIPHDERTFAYNFGFGYALSAIAVAGRHGGRGVHVRCPERRQQRQRPVCDHQLADRGRQQRNGLRQHQPDR